MALSLSGGSSDGITKPGVKRWQLLYADAVHRAAQRVEDSNSKRPAGRYQPSASARRAAEQATVRKERDSGTSSAGQTRSKIPRPKKPDTANRQHAKTGNAGTTAQRRRRSSGYAELEEKLLDDVKIGLLGKLTAVRQKQKDCLREIESAARSLNFPQTIAARPTVKAVAGARPAKGSNILLGQIQREEKNKALLWFRDVFLPSANAKSIEVLTKFLNLVENLNDFEREAMHHIDDYHQATATAAGGKTAARVSHTTATGNRRAGGGGGGGKRQGTGTKRIADLPANLISLGETVTQRAWYTFASALVEDLDDLEEAADRESRSAHHSPPQPEERLQTAATPDQRRQPQVASPTQLREVSREWLPMGTQFATRQTAFAAPPDSLNPHMTEVATTSGGAAVGEATEGKLSPAAGSESGGGSHGLQLDELLASSHHLRQTTAAAQLVTPYGVQQHLSENGVEVNARGQVAAPFARGMHWALQGTHSTQGTAQEQIVRYVVDADCQQLQAQQHFHQVAQQQQQRLTAEAATYGRATLVNNPQHYQHHFPPQQLRATLAPTSFTITTSGADEILRGGGTAAPPASRPAPQVDGRRQQKATDDMPPTHPHTMDADHYLASVASAKEADEGNNDAARTWHAMRSITPGARPFQLISEANRRCGARKPTQQYERPTLCREAVQPPVEETQDVTETVERSAPTPSHPSGGKRQFGVCGMVQTTERFASAEKEGRRSPPHKLFGRRAIAQGQMATADYQQQAELMPERRVLSLGKPSHERAQPEDISTASTQPTTRTQSMEQIPTSTKGNGFVKNVANLFDAWRGTKQSRQLC